MTTDTNIDTRPSQYEFNVTREATDTIRAMHERVQDLGRFWGESSAEYRDASASLGTAMVHLFARPMRAETSVWRDGDLSLCANGGIVFGIIWHGRRRACSDADCGAQINDDGSVWTYSSERFPITDHEHIPTYALDAPQPGTWSFHS